MKDRWRAAQKEGGRDGRGKSVAPVAKGVGLEGRGYVGDQGYKERLEGAPGGKAGDDQQEEEQCILSRGQAGPAARPLAKANRHQIPP